MAGHDRRCAGCGRPLARARLLFQRQTRRGGFAADTGINPSLLKKRFPQLGGRMLEALPRIASSLGIDPAGKLAARLRKTIAGRLRRTRLTQQKQA